MKNAKTAVVVLVMLLLGVGTSFADGWIRTYGGSATDVGCSVAQTTDGGYIVAGFTYSLGTGDYPDVYLVKTDAAGDTVWTRTYGGSSYDWGKSVAQTTDGGYIIAGYTRSFGAGGDDIYLIKTDAAGDTVWTRTYGGSSYEWGLSVAQTADGGYIIAGKTESFGAGLEDVYLVKTDAAGDTVWTRTYGGSDSDVGYSVAQTTDGGYIVVGYTKSFGAGEKDVYLIKTDAAGDTVWTRTYGGSERDGGESVAKTSDGGYIIAGYTESFGTFDVYLVKTDTAGDTVWTRTYGGSSWDRGECVTQTTDGGYIVAGWTESFGTGAYPDVYLIKTEATGNAVWARTYGGSLRDEGFSVAKTSDGGYIVAGYTLSFGAGGDDVYLIKTDSAGYTAVNEPTGQKPVVLSLIAYPNPFNSSCVITAPAGAEVEIYDLLGGYVWGGVVCWLGLVGLVWTPDKSIASGVYLIRATLGKKSTTKKVVLIK